MFYLFKYILIGALSGLMRLLWLLPMRKNEVVFVSFGGKQVSCNPYYIYSFLRVQAVELKLYWIVDKGIDSRNVPESELVFTGSFRYYVLLMTAHVVITNDRLPSYFPFRKTQKLVNTWHGGGAFKSVFGGCSGVKKLYLKKVNTMDARRTYCFLSTSDVFSRVLRKSFNFDGLILPIGYPRNDMFLSPQRNLAASIRIKLGIPVDFYVVLYAPTYRERTSGISSERPFEQPLLDVCSVKRALVTRFGKESVCLFRGHHSMRKGLALEGVIDVSDYPDMQELLLIADMLVTDYSSCMWDYALTRKPCFMYVPDFDRYSKNPGFESDYNDWPFILCKTNDELLSNIDSLSQEQYAESVGLYLQKCGSYEEGRASQLFFDKLMSLLINTD